MFKQIEPFLVTFHRVVSADEWNTALNPDIDRIGERSGTNNMEVKLFRDVIDKFDLVYKYCNEHPREVTWTRTKRSGSASVVRPNNLDGILLRETV